MSDGGYYWRTLAVNKSRPAGVLQAEFPAYARPCVSAADVLGCRVVLVEHNVEYERLRTQVAELTEEQYRRFRDIEIHLCESSDAVVCVSDNDRRRLEADGVRPDLLHTIPHGVDLADMDAGPAINVRERFAIGPESPLLVFHGTYSYPPNQEALRILASRLLPALEERGLICHVLAVGRDAPRRAPHPRIHFSGSVPRLGPWLRAADIAVVPLVDGGGTRMKILDCFAARLPVISTSKGIEGIPAVHGEEALIVDEWPDFVEAVIGLWSDRERAVALAGRGRAFAETLDWNEIAHRYLGLYRSIGA
jgi:glycosyltransferase involved in cell wall biosynthesis